MSTVEPNYPEFDMSTFQSEGYYAIRPENIDEVPFPTPTSAALYQDCLKDMGYTEREIYLKRCLGLDTSTTTDGRAVSDKLVSNALTRALNRWDDVAFRNNLLLYPPNRDKEAPEGLDLIEVGFQKLVASRLPEEERTPDGILAILQSTQETKKLLEDWNCESAQISVVTESPPSRPESRAGRIYSWLGMLPPEDDFWHGIEHLDESEPIYENIAGVENDAEDDSQRTDVITPDVQETSKRRAKKFGATATALLLSGGLVIGAVKAEPIVMGRTPTMSMDTAKPDRKKLRDDYIKEYQKMNITDKVVASLSDPPAHVEYAHGTGLRGIVGKFLGTGTANLIPEGTSRCLNGTPYDPETHQDSATGKITGDASVKPAFGLTADIPTDYEKNPVLLLKGVKASYGYIAAASPESQAILDKYKCFEDFKLPE